MRHSHHVTFDSHGKECKAPISFGAMPIRLPMHPDKELHLVVVKGFGKDPISTYFATVWIGRNVKHEILAEHLKYLSKRMGQIPEFAAYSIAAGLKRAFTRFGKWIRVLTKANALGSSTTDAPMLPEFAEFFEVDYG